MKYFFCNLSVHLIVAVVLLAFLCAFSNKVMKKKADKIYKYFMPVILAIVLTVYCYFIVVPRFFDIRNVVNDNYQTATGVVESVSPLKNFVKIDGVYYYKNPIHYTPAVGETVDVRYSGYANLAIEIDSVQN